MWTAKLNQVTKLNGVVTLTVEYTRDKVESFIEELRVTGKPPANYLSQEVAIRLKQLEDVYLFADTVTVGEITPATLPDLEDEVKLDKAKFVLGQTKKDLELGIISQDEYDAQLVAYKQQEEEISPGELN